MADGVAGRLRSAGVRAGTVAVKIRDCGFRTITRQRTLAEPTDMTEPIYATALELARPEVRGMRVRLLGVTASNLGEREQLACSRATIRAGGGRSRRPMRVRRRYGERAVTRARLLGPGCRRRSSATRATRSIAGRGACRSTPTRTARGGGRADRDSQGDTDLDDIPPDDA